MRFLILAPLFPPDSAHSAIYAKTLAEHLPANQTSVIAYGKLPEKVASVEIYSISKQASKFLLVSRCLRRLFQIKTDILLVNNGPSAEFPALIFSLFSKTSIVLIISDQRACENMTKLHSLIHKTLTARSSAVIEIGPESNYLAPEKLPFTEIDPTVESNQKEWWQNHITTIKSYAK